MPFWDDDGGYTPDANIANYLRMSQEYAGANPGRGKYSTIQGGLNGLGSLLYGMKGRSAERANQDMMSKVLQGLESGSSLEDVTSQMAKSGIPDLQKSALQMKLKALSDDPNKEYRARAAQWNQMGYTDKDPGYREWVLTGKLADPATGAGKHGLNPVYGVDKDGNAVIMQLKESGGVDQAQLPEGVTVSKTPIRLDAGDHFVLLDPVTRQPIGKIAKNVAEKASLQEQGEAQGKAIADMPRIADNANLALDTLNQIRNHPGKDALGWKAPMGMVPGSDALGFANLVDQAAGQTFLEAFNSLRGGGQITEAEGRKATQALSRLDRYQSSEDFWKAIDDLEEVIQAGLARAKAKAGAVPTVPGAPAPDAASVLKQKYGLE